MSDEPTLTVKKLRYSFPIRDVESVRLLQDMGYLDEGRDPDDLYREITTGERHDPETQCERDMKRLAEIGEKIRQEHGWTASDILREQSRPDREQLERDYFLPTDDEE